MTGFINVDKQAGVSSAREVSIIKRLTNTPCGHMGTLDPMASGVLPVAIGNAARLFDYFLSKSKTYVAVFKFGCCSDTLDVTGNVTISGQKVPTAAEIEGVLPEFIGEIDQIPPKYSAKCVNGKRGYQLAREGKDFELSSKRVTVHSLSLIGQEEEDTFKFEIECGGGTYIRSLARDIAARLGTVAVMSGLVRTKSGVFSIEQSVKTELLTAFNISSYIIPTDEVINLKSIYPTVSEAKKLFNGLTVKCEREDGTYKIYDAEGKFYGLSEVREGILKVRTKLC